MRSESLGMMGSFKLSGLIAAPYTPLRPDGDLNVSMIEKQAAMLVTNGISAAFVCGSTGEGMSLTLDERMQVAQRWTEVSGPSLSVIVHTGHNCLRDACTLAAHAQRIGAAATSALPPMYYKPSGAAQTVACAAAVAAAAPQLPFFYYHIPGMTGFPVSMVEFIERGRERIPNLRGIKFTFPDLMEYQRCNALADEKFQIGWGVDEMLLGALAVGARAAVGSTYNYTAPLYHRMINAFQSGDLTAAREASQLSVELIAVLLRFGGVRTGKAIMSMIGLDVGPPRPPFQPLTEDEVAVVRGDYERLGFFDAIAQPARSSMSKAGLTA
jgi:N-acetylneuraminate lyase